MLISDFDGTMTRHDFLETVRRIFRRRSLFLESDALRVDGWLLLYGEKEKASTN